MRQIDLALFFLMAFLLVNSCASTPDQEHEEYEGELESIEAQVGDDEYEDEFSGGDGDELAIDDAFNDPAVNASDDSGYWERGVVATADDEGEFIEEFLEEGEESEDGDIPYVEDGEEYYVVEEGDQNVEDDLEALMDGEGVDEQQGQIAVREVERPRRRQTVFPNLNITRNSLLKAARVATPETIRYFLSTGIPIDHQNHYGNTALHEAAKNNRFEIVHLLLKRGANLTVRNRLGETALDIAKRKGNALVINVFEDNGRAISSQK